MIGANEIKTLMLIPDGDLSKDSYIELMIPVAIGIINDYCGTSFDSDSLPESLKFAVAQIIQFAMNNKMGVTSESMGNYSVNYGNGTAGLPQQIKDLLTPYVIKQDFTLI